MTMEGTVVKLEVLNECEVLQRFASSSGDIQSNLTHINHEGGTLSAVESFEFQADNEVLTDNHHFTQHDAT